MKRLSAIGLVALVCLAAQTGLSEDGKQDLAGADRPRLTFKGHDAAVTRLAWSADGSRVASFSQEGVQIWEAATGKKLWKMKLVHADAGAFSNDLKSVAIARFDKLALREKVTLHDALNGREMLSVEPYVVWDRKVPYMFRPLTTAVAFSPNGRRLATAGSVVKSGGPHGLPGGVVTLWDVGTGKELWRYDRLSTIADAVAFSLDGKSLAAGTWGALSELPEPGEAAVWNAETGVLVRTFKVKPNIDWDESLYSMTDVVIDPGSTHLATAVADGTVRLWELSSGRAIMTLRAHTGDPVNVADPTGMIGGPSKAVRCLAFSPDGSRLAAAGYERVVRIWNARTGEETNAFRIETPWIAALAFSPDGRQLAAGGGTTKSGEVVLWQFAPK